MSHKYDEPVLSEGYPEFEFDKMGDHFYCCYWEVDEDAISD